MWPPQVFDCYSKAPALVSMWNSTVFKEEGQCNYLTATAYRLPKQGNSGKTGLLLP